jgi:hypothetical protein
MPRRVKILVVVAVVAVVALFAAFPSQLWIPWTRREST